MEPAVKLLMVKVSQFQNSSVLPKPQLPVLDQPLLHNQLPPQLQNLDPVNQPQPHNNSHNSSNNNNSNKLPPEMLIPKLSPLLMSQLNSNHKVM